MAGQFLTKSFQQPFSTFAPTRAATPEEHKFNANKLLLPSTNAIVNDVSGSRVVLLFLLWCQ